MFQKSHNRAGEPTEFASKFRKAKIHTIRSNYALWRKRFDEIEAGEACISVRQWSGLPYRSKQVEIARLTKEDGIGIECLFIRKGGIGESGLVANVDGFPVDANVLAANDGLDYEDWQGWFDNDKMLTYSNCVHPLPIIHFTGFRYEKGGEQCPN